MLKNFVSTQLRCWLEDHCSGDHTLKYKLSGAEAVRLTIGDDQSEIAFVENDNSTSCTNPTNCNRTVNGARIWIYSFDTGGVNEKMRLDSSGTFVGNTSTSVVEDHVGTVLKEKLN